MKTRIMSAVGVGLLVAATSGFAVPVVETWTDDGVASWTVQQTPTAVGLPYGTVANPGGGLLHAGALDITGGASGTAPRDFISTTTAGFIGNYGSLGVQGIHFDFYVASGTMPSLLSLYFVGAGVGNTWFYNLTPQLTLAPGWNTIGANISTNSPNSAFGNWEQSPEWGIGSTWATDIGSVTRIGLELSYLSDVGGQIYGVDNFTLDDEPFLVPEPETYVVLGIALLTMAFVFRKRITDSLAEARAMIQM